jgi:site-specific recombinase XerD
VSNILSARTRQLYRQAWESLNRFLTSNNMTASLPLSQDTVLAYIAFLDSNGFAASSIASHVLVFNFVHKIQGFANPGDSFVIKRVINKLTSNKPPDARRPITRQLLLSIINGLPFTAKSAYEIALFRCMFITAFTAMLRISEVCSGNRTNHTLLYEHTLLTPEMVSVTLSTFKHSSGPVTLVLKSDNSELCPVRAMRAYLQQRGYKPGCLFVFSDDLPVSRSKFVAFLKRCLNYCGEDTKSITSHSFRIGEATNAAQNGYSDDEI